MFGVIVGCDGCPVGFSRLLNEALFVGLDFGFLRLVFERLNVHG
jgi:hypothetical protein